MRLFRYILLVIMCFYYYGSLAQTQQGYVKTLGRPDKKGEALSGVSVRVKGGHNTVLSKNDGTFSMMMTGLKVGDAYSLQQVQKAGYELNEIGVIGRQYAFSDKVPLTIVMVSTSQLQADKQRIENNAYKVAERNYKAKMAQLEKDKDAGIITIEQYRTQIQDLQDKFEKYQSLIDDLANHYAHTDYDVLDEKEREINICIENGDLERADLLIHVLFDPVDVLKRNKEALSHIDQNLRQANDIMAQANADMAAVLKQQEKDAEYLYQLYTITLSRYDNENASKYIETRALLDTTNVEWQLAAGHYVEKINADYDKAMSYFQLAVRQARLQYGDNDWTAIGYNNIGMNYYYRNDFSNAEINISKAKDIWESVVGENDILIAAAYNNLGAIYDSKGDYESAMENYVHALKIREYLYGSDHLSIAESLNNIGGLYQLQGDYDKSLEYYEKAIKIRKQILGDDKEEIAQSYNNLGILYSELGNYSEALDYLMQGNKIYEKVYGINHPEVATIYNNIGDIYNCLGNTIKAKEYHNKALDILIGLLGSDNWGTIRAYIGLGKDFLVEEDYKPALELFMKVLAIEELHDKPACSELSLVYNNIGAVYQKLGNFSDALIYYQKALEIDVLVFGDTHPNVGIYYNNIGSVYNSLEDYDNALENLIKALHIFENYNSPDISKLYYEISKAYSGKRDYEKAREYQKNLFIQ